MRRADRLIELIGCLTKTAVDGLRPPGKQGEQSFLWDGELKGFGVRAIHSGLKTFILHYRDADGRTRRIKLGRFGAITVENARNLAKVKFGELAKGNDPAKKRDTRRMWSDLIGHPSEGHHPTQSNASRPRRY